jgi:hypothetical protein
VCKSTWDYGGASYSGCVVTPLISVAAWCYTTAPCTRSTPSVSLINAQWASCEEATSPPPITASPTPSPTPVPTSPPLHAPCVDEPICVESVQPLCAVIPSFNTTCPILCNQCAPNVGRPDSSSSRLCHHGTRRGARPSLGCIKSTTTLAPTITVNLPVEVQVLTTCFEIGCDSEWHVSHMCGCDSRCLTFQPADCCADYNRVCLLLSPSNPPRFT